MLETRPYMRAKFGYATFSEEYGTCCGRSIPHYEELLELNPLDNQVVRYALIGACCRQNRFKQAARVLDELSEDVSYGTYDRLLNTGCTAYRTSCNRCSKPPRKSNPHVPRYLTGKKRLPRTMPVAYAWGDESEAAVHANDRFSAWKKQKPLLRRLAERT